MHWSSVTILLALLFATACSQRGGRRYHPDQLLEESSSEENHRFQTRSRGDVGDARRGDGRRTRTQETTEASNRQLGSRSRAKTEEPRQFHSLSGKEHDNRQFISRKTSHEAEPRKFTSREETRNERFNSRELSATTESPPRNQDSVRSRTRTEGRDLEYKTRGTNTIRISGTGTQGRGEHRRTNHDLERPTARGSRRQENRDRTQIIRNGNVIEPPKRIEPVTERFHSRQSSKEELQKRLDETTEINISSNEYKPITEAKIQDFSTKSNSIEVEKSTRPVDIASTENFYVRQSSREEGRKVRLDPSTEKNDFPQIRGRKKSQELPIRGGGTESRRRTRPIDTPVTERFHSRQLSREDIPVKRGRFATSTEQLRNNEEYEKNTRIRGSNEFRSRGNGIVFDKRKLSESISTESAHSRQSVREKFKNNRIEDSTTESSRVLPVTSEIDITLETPNKEANVIENESKVQADNLVSDLTTEIKTSVESDELKPTTKHSDPLPTENTVDFPIKSNDVEEPNRASRKLESNIPERNSYHRGQNRDFENTNRGRLESSLSRERSRVAQGPSTKAAEGRRSSRRFNTQSTEATHENINENRERRKLQRLPSRTRTTDTSDVRGRSRLIESPIRHRNKDLPAAKSRTEDRTPEAVLLPEIVTESRTEGKIFSEIKNEQKNEVTIGAPTEASVTSTQRSLGRIVAFKKPGNRGRGQSKAIKAIDEKEQHSGEVRDDDNYPEVYKQLKKSGTDSKDILSFKKTTKSTIYTPSTAEPPIAINRDKSNDASTTEVLSIDPRFGGLPPSNIEKPVMALKDSNTFSAKVSTSNTKLTSTMPTATTSKSGTKHNTDVIASKAKTKATTNKPTTKATTRKPTTKATTTKPATKALNVKPTMKATTTKPVTKATTKKPTMKTTTIKPATKPRTNKPPLKATTHKPTTKATTIKPTVKASATGKPTTKATTSKPVVKATTSKPTTKATTVKPFLKPTIKPSTKVPLHTTAKPAPKTTTSKGTTPKSTQNIISKATHKPAAKPTQKPTTVRSTSKVNSRKPTPSPTTTKTTVKTPTLKKTQANKPTAKTNGKKQEKNTIKTPLSDAELLNDLLNQVENNKILKGTTESSAQIADKVIQLAIERAQKSTVAPLLKDISYKEDLQQLSSTTTSVKKQTLGRNHKENSNNFIEEEKTNKTGKISLWVIPPGESTTTSKASSGVSQSEAELLNVLLSSPNAIEKLSLSDQLLLAEVLSSTAFPQTTRKKKKKAKTSTTTTTTPAPPTFPILQYLFGRNRGNGGGLFQRGLFRGGGLRGLESAGTTVPQDDGGIFQNDGLPQGQGELAAESQEDPQQGERGGLVNAARNVSRAVSQFMGFVIQGAANSFQNYFQTRTRALAESLSYPES